MPDQTTIDQLVQQIEADHAGLVGGVLDTGLAVTEVQLQECIRVLRGR